MRRSWPMMRGVSRHCTCLCKHRGVCMCWYKLRSVRMNCKWWCRLRDVCRCMLRSVSRCWHMQRGVLQVLPYGCWVLTRGAVLSLHTGVGAFQT